MKVLITGAAGFIGSHTAEYLLQKRYKVVVVDNFSTGRLENLKNFSGSIEDCDITNAPMLEAIFNRFRPEIILHFAAQSAITTAWMNPHKDANVNVLGTMNLIEMGVKYGARKFVFASTSAVYGKGRRFFASRETDRCEPDTPYGVSKLASEQYIRMFFPNHVILRYANIYGPRQKPIGENQVIARAFNHFLHGTDFNVVGNGNQKRDFVFIDDLVFANYLAVSGQKSGTYNVATGKSHSVNETLSMLEEYFEVRGYKWTHTTEEDKRGSVYINGDKFRNDFGWKPKNYLLDGIAATADWWRDSR